MKNKNGLVLHPEILRKRGKPEFVVLPFEEFRALQEVLEDAEDLLDLLDLREAKAAEGDAPGRPLREIMKEMGLETEDLETNRKR